MESQTIIEKVSKGSKSSFSKGNLLEQKHSKNILNQGIPVLVSSQLLRSRKMGQIDQAFINSHGELELWEIKCHPHLVSKSQIRRISASAHFLGILLNKTSKIRFIN